MDWALFTGMATVLGSTAGASASIPTSWMTNWNQRMREHAKAELRGRESPIQNLAHSDEESLAAKFDVLSIPIAYPRLDECEIAEAAAFGQKCSFRKDEVLVASGDRSFDSYTILSGRVRIIDISTGERVCFVRYGARYFTGDIDLFTGRPSVVSCEAESDVEAIRIKPHQLREMFVKKPALGERYWKAFQQRRQLQLQSPFRGVSVYGPKDDKRTVEAVELLYRNCVPHFWWDTTLEENAARLGQLKREVSCYPVVTHGGKLLCDCATRTQLADVVGLRRKIPEKKYDVIILGSGPAGLGAALAASSEGLSTLALDGLGPGGQAGSSSKIENYAGFPDGITGRELAYLAYLQALKFGADFVAPSHVTKIDRSIDGSFRVESSQGDCVGGKAVILATGVSYNSLDIRSLHTLLGKGVFYSATKIEAEICKDRPVHIVGGGNSAGQAAMFLSQFTPHVSLIVRGRSLQQSMSSYLLERVLANHKITIRYSTNVVEVEGVDYIRAVCVRDEQGEVKAEQTSGLFIFIGAKPKTGFIPSSIAKDSNGFILTGSDVAELPAWTEKRPPYSLETSLAGVFACGDCRSALTKRISFAMADGAVAAASIDELLGA